MHNRQRLRDTQVLQAGAHGAALHWLLSYRISRASLSRQIRECKRHVTQGLLLCADRAGGLSTYKRCMKWSIAMIRLSSLAPSRVSRDMHPCYVRVCLLVLSPSVLVRVVTAALDSA